MRVLYAHKRYIILSHCTCETQIIYIELICYIQKIMYLCVPDKRQINYQKRKDEGA